MRRSGYLIVGIFVGLLVSIPISAIADNLVGKKVDTVVQVKLDGEYLPVPAVGIEGTTYAPVRALAEALGKNVDWDGEVIIESPEKIEETDVTESEVDRVQIDREALLEEAMKDEGINYIAMLKDRIASERDIIEVYQTTIEFNESIGAPKEVNQKLEESIRQIEERIAEYEQKLAELQAEQPSE